MTHSHNTSKHAPAARSFIFPLLLIGTLVSACSGVDEGRESFDDPFAVAQVTQASSCSNPGNQRVLIQDFMDSQGLPPDSIRKNQFPVGQYVSVKNNITFKCSGAYLGGGYYLSAGSCNYAVNDSITFTQPSLINYLVEQVIKTKNTSSLNYALLKLKGAGELEIEKGVMRLAKRTPVTAEKIGAITQTGGQYFFVGGSVIDTSPTNRISHRLDTPVGALGSPIIDKDGYVIAIHTDDTCTGGTGANKAMRIDKILPDLTTADQQALTELQPCTGMTTAGNTAWADAGVPNVIKVTVSTAHCGYAVTPIYFASLGGNYDHEVAISETAIYDRSATGFRVNVQKAGLNPVLANNLAWYLNWQAFPQNYDDGHAYRCAGTTAKGGWTASANGIYQTITMPLYCKTSNPRGLHVAVIGDKEHRAATGIYSVLQDTVPVSYRVFLQSAAGITKDQANSWGWALNWQFSADGGAGRQEAAGQASGQWFAFNNGISSGVSMYVQTGVDWNLVPKYFTSLRVNGKAPAPGMTGINAIYSPIETGFQVYVTSPGVTEGEANSGWTLNWAARP